MKRYCFGIFLSILMTLTAWVQGADAPFDMAKTQKELEIMRGIFKTTLSVDSDDSQGVNFFQFAEIRYMYLEGQGANFFLKVLDFDPQGFSLNLGFDTSLLESRLKMTEENLKRLQENLKRNEESVADFYSSRSESQNSDKDTVNDFNRAQQNYEKYMEAFSSAEAALAEKQEAMKQNKQAQKAMIEKQRENRRPKLPEIKQSLIEAVANYGDSLTVVEPDEYINLVFDTSGQYEIVAIQKSWIKDYKAGKLTLDQFKAKAIQYSMKGR